MTTNEIYTMSIDQIQTGKTIFNLIRQKGYTVRDVMECTGVSSPQAVYRWKAGNTIPDTDNLARLSAMLLEPVGRLIIVQAGGKTAPLDQIIAEATSIQRP